MTSLPEIDLTFYASRSIRRALRVMLDGVYMPLTCGSGQARPEDISGIGCEDSADFTIVVLDWTERDGFTGLPFKALYLISLTVAFSVENKIAK